MRVKLTRPEETSYRSGALEGGGEKSRCSAGPAEEARAPAHSSLLRNEPSLSDFLGDGGRKVSKCVCVCVCLTCETAQVLGHTAAALLTRTTNSKILRFLGQSLEGPPVITVTVTPSVKAGHTDD